MEKLTKEIFINKVCLKITFLKVKKKDLMYTKTKKIYIYLFKHPKNLRGLGFGTCFLLLLCDRGRCFYCASGVLYYLEV